MKWFSVCVAMLFLSSCSPQAESIHTADELAADQTLLTKIIGECLNNPGELHDTPNCRNAEAADGRLRPERMRKSLGG